jgi:HKD family nuclease
MFYSQPLSTRFGTNLVDQLIAGKWTSLDIAVAWVRASGIAHLEKSLSSFLTAGNIVKITVGVDLDNTTKEGLASLLALQAHGQLSIFIHHNEAGPIFHPKLYLFQNKTHAKLIVASNNITQAGLYRNTEAGLEIELEINDPVIISAQNALEAWRETTLGTAKQLDTAFLDDLIDNGYVTDENAVKAALASRNARTGAGGKPAKKLFKAITVTAPKSPIANPSTSSIHSKLVVGGTSTAIPNSGTATGATPGPGLVTQTVGAAQQPGQALLMRVRTSRGTQAQIPMREPFFAGVTQAYSVATGVLRKISATHPTRAHGTRNTLKLEMPETRGMIEPVARFEHTETGMQFEVYEASTPKGQLIMQSLQAGMTSSPVTTQMTQPWAPSNSTWWCVI